MKDKKIIAVRNWPKLKLVWDIQVFIDIDNFYQSFIQGSSRIAAPFTSMLKTTRSSGLVLRKLRVNDNKVIGLVVKLNREIYLNLKIWKIVLN